MVAILCLVHDPSSCPQFEPKRLWRCPPSKGVAIPRAALHARPTKCFPIQEHQRRKLLAILNMDSAPSFCEPPMRQPRREPPRDQDGRDNAEPRAERHAPHPPPDNAAAIR